VSSSRRHGQVRGARGQEAQDDARGITAEYDLIAPRIATEFDLWSRGTRLYY
jgi:hypothetical protein